jgi:hypothetical protein
MIIIKLLLGLFFIWLFINILQWLLKGFIIYKLNNLHKRPFHHHSQQTNAPSQDNQTLVQCAHCGIYVVKTQALERAGQYYCSKEHLP